MKSSVALLDYRATWTIMFVDTQKENWENLWEAIIIISIIITVKGHWESVVGVGVEKKSRSVAGVSQLGMIENIWVMVRISLRFHSKNL